MKERREMKERRKEIKQFNIFKIVGGYMAIWSPLRWPTEVQEALIEDTN